MAAPRPRLGPYYQDGGRIKRGYWGPVTSSIDWCEKNYEVTPYVAEFSNTFTNIGFVILGGTFALYVVRISCNLLMTPQLCLIS